MDASCYAEPQCRVEKPFQVLSCQSDLLSVQLVPEKVGLVVRFRYLWIITHLGNCGDMQRRHS